ncbi:site-specific integrase [Candidatus Phyllobacterium onerii]|uniref:site-specific integrase n=1 Tax=Candidatus Phyllobacterium onerii TaxID=3020828 RepID=UPI00232D9A85|nr:site-specific integrase [Phyllobacterium sp. IY22]
MAKNLVEAIVSTRNSRLKLSEGEHWRALDADVHLGYRRGKRAGRWLVRWYGEIYRKGKTVAELGYRRETLAAADDVLEADGVDCLSFDQAKLAAIKKVETIRASELASARGPVLTVKSAVDNYLLLREAKEAKGGRQHDAKRRLTKHVLKDPIAETPLHVLLEDDLSAWRRRRPADISVSTVRRIINDLKAALNGAAAAYRTRLPAQLPIVIKNGLSTEEATAPIAREKQALTDSEIRKLIIQSMRVDEEGGWEGDLARMILALASTGARFSQVARMTVADLQPGKSRLMVPTSRKGRGVKTSTHTAIRVGSDVIDALVPAVAGRRGPEPLLMRWRHKQVSGEDRKLARWVKDERGPWLNATELSRPWRLIATAAGLPIDVVPYSFRHSSIVRQLRAGLPVRLVAALHDTSSEMIERHYSAAIVDALDTLAAGAVIDLMPDRDNVVRIAGK